METVKVKCLNTINYHIIVYDNNNVLYDLKSFNGVVCFNLFNYGIYKIKLSSLGYQKTIIYYYNGKCNNIYFSFDNNAPIKIIRLTDKYYLGLPIMKGEITFWQSHTQ